LKLGVDSRLLVVAILAVGARTLQAFARASPN
jgi:hypothetical protein